jgi:hypothetical protein
MFTITAYLGCHAYLGCLPSQHIQVLPSLLIGDVKVIMAIWNIIVTTDLDTSLFAYLFILYSCSSLHHPNQLVHLSVPGTSQI